MNPAFESVGASGSTSFIVRKFEEKKFSAPYHFHPEVELTLILEGCGKRYVGTSMHNYVPGDLVLLGSHLPHCWKTEEASTQNSISVVIHFNHDFLGKEFFGKPELKEVVHLLNKSIFGLHFTGNIGIVKEKMIGLLTENDPYKKLITLLDILHHLATKSTYVMLDNQNAYFELSYVEKNRVNVVMAYIVDNFQGKISLNEVASIANMTPSAFCKYFKRVTRKSFVEVVNDYRIDFAVRQLIQTDKAISQIGFDSGFNEISNFHRTFKTRIKLSPLNYRNTFQKILS